jgi:hypothetical protein
VIVVKCTERDRDALKEIYIDGKLAESKRLDELYPSIPKVEPKKIAWSEFKK